MDRAGGDCGGSVGGGMADDRMSDPVEVLRKWRDTGFGTRWDVNAAIDAVLSRLSEAEAALEEIQNRDLRLRDELCKAQREKREAQVREVKAYRFELEERKRAERAEQERDEYRVNAAAWCKQAEHLEQENKRLREALEQIDNISASYAESGIKGHYAVIQRARAALASQPTCSRCGHPTEDHSPKCLHVECVCIGARL